MDSALVIRESVTGGVGGGGGGVMAAGWKQLIGGGRGDGAGKFREHVYRASSEREYVEW